MNNYGKKFRLIFIPFLLIAFATIIIYSFLHWALFIKADIFRVDEMILNLIVPMVIPGIPILIWLRPRIKLLKLNTKGRRDPVALYIMLAWFTIAAATIIAQDYLITATGKLTRLNTIGQIEQLPLTKYYTLQHSFIDKKLARAKTTFEVSGKHNENFDMYIYVPCPIFDDEHSPDTASGNVHAWLAIKYYKTISNNLSSTEKDSSFKEFARESQQDFDNKDLNNFVYLDRIGYSSDFKNYTAAINSDRYPSASSKIIILSPVNESFESRNGDKLQWIFGSISIGSVIFLFALLFAPLRDDALEVDIKAEGGKDISSALMWMRGLFAVKSKIQVTRMLIGINLLIFLIMVCCGLGFISFSGEDLLKWGANYRPLVNQGQYWRLLSCMFLHGGLMHVLFNMYGLFFVGLFLEPAIGSRKYIICYFITGIIASLASIWWHPATISIGASGAIFGLYGVFFALLTTNIFPPSFKKPFLINTAIFIGYNLLYGLAGGIDNAAHIGGLLSGFILGYIMYALFKDQLRQQPEFNHQEIVDELNNKDTSDVTT